MNQSSEAYSPVGGTVIPGDGRGRVLGFPTANLDLDPSVVPEDGVYVAAAHVDGHDAEFDATVSVGTNPTFSGVRDPRVEVYLHDVTIDLYGKHMMVVLIQRLRGTVAFSDVDELIAQTERDVVVSRAIHAGRHR